MSTAARKERKRSGEKFIRQPKVGTPLEERQIGAVFDPHWGSFRPSRRQRRRIADAIKIRDMDKEPSDG